MDNLASRFAPFVTVFLLVLNITGHVSAAPEGPPVVPEGFDVKALRRAAADIETPRNYQMLKFGLFMAPDRASLSKKQALAVLNEIAGQQKPGSEKWLLLNSVRAYGMFRQGRPPDEDMQAGLRIYSEIFKTDVASLSRLSTIVLERTLEDYVLGCSGKFAEIQVYLTDGESERSTLMEALSCYIVYRSNRFGLKPRYLPFHRAFENAFAKKSQRLNAMDLLIGTGALNAGDYNLLALGLYGCSKDWNDKWKEWLDKTADALSASAFSDKDLAIEKNWFSQTRQFMEVSYVVE